MINNDSYRLMEALRTHLLVNAYKVGDNIEVVLQFRTTDGKIHQLCNTFVKA